MKSKERGQRYHEEISEISHWTHPRISRAAELFKSREQKARWTAGLVAHLAEDLMVILHANFVAFTRVSGRKRERGDWGDTSGFGNPPPNKIPRPRLGEEMLRVLTRSSVCNVISVTKYLLLFVQDAGSIIGKGGSNIKRLRQQVRGVTSCVD